MKAMSPSATTRLLGHKSVSVWMLLAISLASLSGAEIKIPVLVITPANKGEVGYARVQMDASPGRPLSVAIVEDGPSQAGNMYRASVWQACTVIALRRSSPLSQTRLTVEIEGGIDGPSAGMAIAIGIDLLLDGKQFPENTCLTGAILPDGSIGGVGGILEKCHGAAQAGMKRIIYPRHQAIVSNINNSASADVRTAVEKLGMEAMPVSDIDEAIRRATGATTKQYAVSTEIETPRAIDVALRNEYLKLRAACVADHDSLPEELKQRMESVLSQEIAYTNGLANADGQLAAGNTLVAIWQMIGPLYYIDACKALKAIETTLPSETVQCTRAVLEHTKKLLQVDNTKTFAAIDALYKRNGSIEAAQLATARFSAQYFSNYASSEVEQIANTLASNTAIADTEQREVANGKALYSSVRVLPFARTSLLVQIEAAWSGILPNLRSVATRPDRSQAVSTLMHQAAIGSITTMAAIPDIAQIINSAFSNCDVKYELSAANTMVAEYESIPPQSITEYDRWCSAYMSCCLLARTSAIITGLEVGRSVDATGTFHYANLPLLRRLIDRARALAIRDITTAEAAGIPVLGAIATLSQADSIRDDHDQDPLSVYACYVEAHLVARATCMIVGAPE